VTSLTRLLQRPVAIAEVITPLVEAFREVFHVETRFGERYDLKRT
jgi:lipoate-protein ligase A